MRLEDLPVDFKSIVERAEAAEAALAKALDTETLRSIIWSHTGCSSLLAAEAAEAICDAALDLPRTSDSVQSGAATEGEGA